MRKAEGKRYGYVVLPVVVPSGDDPERALDRNDAYSHVWQVLQALRAHDERFDAYVNKLDLNKSNDGPISIIGVGSKEDEADGVDALGDAGARVAQGLLDFDPRRVAHRHHRPDREALRRASLLGEVGRLRNRHRPTPRRTHPRFV